jgi:DNA polymerase-1
VTDTGVTDSPVVRHRAVPHLITTVEELREAVAYLLTQPHFVIDVETTFGNAHTNEVLWVGLGARAAVYLIPINHPIGYVDVPEHVEMRIPPENERKVLASGALSKAKRRYKVPTSFTERLDQLPPGVVFAELEPLLFSDRGKIGQNTKFDLISVSKYYGGNIPPGPYHDNIVITHLLDENRMKYDLKTVTMDWLDVPQSRRAAFYPNLGRSGIEIEPVDAVARYLAKDIRYTWLYFRNQFPRLAKQGLTEAYKVEMDLYGVLMRMECNGFPVDGKRMDVVKSELEEELRSVAGEAWSIAGYQFEMTNLNIKRDLLFNPKKLGGQGLKPKSYTEKTNTAQLNKATLEYYAERGNRLAQVFLEFSALEKLRGTFIEGLGKHLIDGRIHTSFKQHGTVTGRLSAHQPNLQQIPARGDGAIIREMFVALPGKSLVVADYDQIELRCAAFLSGDTAMMEVFKQGQDIHRAAAAAMYTVDMDEVTKEQRQAGKGQNFLTLYGGGAAKLARTAGVDVPTAELFIKRYYQQFPHLGAWKDSLVEAAQRAGRRTDPFRYPPYVLIPPFNRRRRIPDLYSPHEYDRYRGERQAVNAVVQGFASYVMKLALIELDRQLPSLDAVMLVTVHDEIVVMCDVDTAVSVKDTVSAIMGSVTLAGEPILGEVPLVASADIGRTWAEAKG